MVALSGAALARGAMILAELKQRRLLDAGPELRAAQRDQVAPEIAASADLDVLGAGHGCHPGQGRGRLCGGPLFNDRLRLQAVQVVDGALGVAGGGEDETLLVLQHGQRTRNVCRFCKRRVGSMSSAT